MKTTSNPFLHRHFRTQNDSYPKCFSSRFKRKKRSLCKQTCQVPQEEFNLPLFLQFPSYLCNILADLFQEKKCFNAPNNT